MAEMTLEEMDSKNIEYFDSIHESLYSVEPELQGSELVVRFKMGEVFSYRNEKDPDEEYFKVIDNPSINRFGCQVSDGRSLGEAYNQLAAYIDDFLYEPYNYGTEIAAYDDREEACADMDSRFPQFSIDDVKRTLRDEILREICADELDYETEKETFESTAV